MFAVKSPTGCSVPSCIKDPSHACFPIPKSRTRAKIWMNKCGIEKRIAGKTMVCEAHFPPISIIHKCGTKQLARGTIPSLNLPHEEFLIMQTSFQNNIKNTIITHKAGLTKQSQANYTGEFGEKVIIKPHTSISPETPDRSTHTESFHIKPVGAHSDSSAIDNIQPITDLSTHTKSVNETCLKLQTSKHTLNSLTDNNAARIITELQQKLQFMSEYSGVFKMIALKIYLKCTRGYEILHRILRLPPVIELKSMFDGCKISMEDTQFTSVLQYKSEIMSIKQRQCVLSMGTIDVNKFFYYDIKRDRLVGISDINNIQKPLPAYKILVLFLQGLYSGWKQPIDIAFLSSPKNDNLVCLDQWIEKNIGNLLKIGFRVRAVVCDNDDLLMTTSPHHEPYRKKMYYIHDIASLMRLFLYTFQTHDFIFGYKIAKMQDVLDYVELDIKNHPRLSPELTENTLKQISFLEVSVKDVINIISSKTVTAMTTYINLQALNPTAKNTVELIAKMSTLLEVLYSNKCDYASRETCKRVLLDMLTFFDEIKIINKTTKKIVAAENSFVDKFKSTIKAILLLSADMKYYDDDGNAFPKKRLSLENVRSFFGQIKQVKRGGTTLTCKNVYLAYLHSALLNILKPYHDGKLENDLELNLNKIKNIVAKPERNFKNVNINVSLDIKIKSSEYNKLDFTNKDAIIYLSGFLLKKCYDHHSDCDSMKNYTFIVLQDTCSICKSILKEIQEGICVVPQESFIEFVEMMEIRFRSFMTKQILESKNGLVTGLLDFMKPVIFPMPCLCFPINYAKKLYVRVRIYNLLTYNNNCLSLFPEQCKNITINDL